MGGTHLTITRASKALLGILPFLNPNGLYCKLVHRDRLHYKLVIGDRMCSKQVPDTWPSSKLVPGD